jgi:hypothetical protein
MYVTIWREMSFIGEINSLLRNIFILDEAYGLSTEIKLTISIITASFEFHKGKI